MMNRPNTPKPVYEIGDLVEKHTGDARYSGMVVAVYWTRKQSLRYVVEVEPQGFQMIAHPDTIQLKTR